MILLGASCSDSTAPASTGSEFSVLNARAGAAGPPIEARAIGSASGTTKVEVTLGRFPYFTPGGALVPASPGAGYITKVHVKFCKPLPPGLKQFSANFEYKSNDPADKEPDDEPDSPLDPDDKAKKQVNWDRSAKHTILTGGSTGAFDFTGITRDAVLEIRVHYVVPETKKDGKLENKHYEIKLCIPVLSPPDLQIIPLNWRTQGPLNTPIAFRSSIGARGTAAIPSSTQCVAYVDGAVTPAASSGTIVVDPSTGAFCELNLVFTATGSHTVLVRLEGTTPGDDNPANDAASQTITINGGSDLTVLGISANPTILETFLKTTTATYLVYPDGSRVTFPSENTFDARQSSSIGLAFNRILSGPATFTVSQVTSVGTTLVTLHSGTVNFSGPNQTFSNSIGDAFSLTHTVDPIAGTSTLIYLANSSTTDLGPNTGTFKPYGESITFSFVIVNQGYTYTFSHTVPIRTSAPVLDTKTGCTPDVKFTLCETKSTEFRRKDGEGGQISVNIPGVRN